MAPIYVNGVSTGAQSFEIDDLTPINFTNQWPYYVSGLMYSAAFSCIANSTIASVADRLDAIPWIPVEDITIDQATIDITTGVGAATAKICIYEANASTGLPTTLIQASPSLDCSVAAVVTWTVSQAFTAGTVYWIGVHSSSTQTYRGIPVSALKRLNDASSGNTSNGIYRVNSTYASGAPASFGAGSYVSAICPLVRWRKV